MACENPQTGFLPIVDVGSNHNGYSGGKYRNGNQRPRKHTNQGIEIANSIVPLNAGGGYDPTETILLMSVGMSHCSVESTVFNTILTTKRGLGLLHPRFQFVNAAVGGGETGGTAERLMDPDHISWTEGTVAKLVLAGYTAAQVQIVWLKTAIAGPVGTFPDSAFLFRDYMREIVGTNIRIHFPNVKMVYLSSRTYAGYSDSELSPEPYAYETGLVCKWIIEEQCYNCTNESKYGPTAPSWPWVSWGPYFWADGITANSEGDVWICPDDFDEDLTHLSSVGYTKNANKMYDTFSTDETCQPWMMA